MTNYKLSLLHGKLQYGSMKGNRMLHRLKSLTLPKKKKKNLSTSSLGICQTQRSHPSISKSHTLAPCTQQQHFFLIHNFSHPHHHTKTKFDFWSLMLRDKLLFSHSSKKKTKGKQKKGQEIFRLNYALTELGVLSGNTKTLNRRSRSLSLPMSLFFCPLSRSAPFLVLSLMPAHTTANSELLN